MRTSADADARAAPRRRQRYRRCGAAPSSPKPPSENLILPTSLTTPRDEIEDFPLLALSPNHPRRDEERLKFLVREQLKEKRREPSEEGRIKDAPAPAMTQFRRSPNPLPVPLWVMVHRLARRAALTVEASRACLPMVDWSGGFLSTVSVFGKISSEMFGRPRIQGGRRILRSFHGGNKLRRAHILRLAVPRSLTQGLYHALMGQQQCSASAEPSTAPDCSRFRAVLRVRDAARERIEEQRTYGDMEENNRFAFSRVDRDYLSVVLIYTYSKIVL